MVVVALFRVFRFSFLSRREGILYFPAFAISSGEHDGNSPLELDVRAMDPTAMGRKSALEDFN